MLVEKGILNEDGEFLKQRQLVELRNAYAKVFDKEAAQPITYTDGTSESIAHYIDRLSKYVHQAKDGTLYFVKDNAKIIAGNAHDQGGYTTASGNMITRSLDDRPDTGPGWVNRVRNPFNR